MATEIPHPTSDLVPTSDIPHPPSDIPSDSASEILSTRTISDTLKTDPHDPHGPNLATSAANFRATDPARAFNDPYTIPDRHIERLEKAGRRIAGPAP